jgi:UDP-N-acetylglucosamine 4-epimerase
MQTNNPEALNTVYNVAYGARTSLNELAKILKDLLSAHDPAIAAVPVLHGPERLGDVPHFPGIHRKGKAATWLVSVQK